MLGRKKTCKGRQKRASQNSRNNKLGFPQNPIHGQICKINSIEYIYSDEMQNWIRADPIINKILRIIFRDEFRIVFDGQVEVPNCECAKVVVEQNGDTKVTFESGISKDGECILDKNVFESIFVVHWTQKQPWYTTGS